ncbi:hypothetical protein [Zooshikella harenae]|uniref:Uncharacterized protein n=1 Tax=Zooshikella harenae TaxID=2827238 RepID=A0ABS5Z9U9_9GAMM|nr:hypothetical protein [Zooshikella harenae]MBU2710829.1 hypothetical protein [Zooshikella harenae]
MRAILLLIIAPFFSYASSFNIETIPNKYFQLDSEGMGIIEQKQLANKLETDSWKLIKVSDRLYKINNKYSGDSYNILRKHGVICINSITGANSRLYCINESTNKPIGKPSIHINDFIKPGLQYTKFYQHPIGYSINDEEKIIAFFLRNGYEKILSGRVQTKNIEVKITPQQTLSKSVVDIPHESWETFDTSCLKITNFKPNDTLSLKIVKSIANNIIFCQDDSAFSDITKLEQNQIKTDKLSTLNIKNDAIKYATYKLKNNNLVITEDLFSLNAFIIDKKMPILLRINLETIGLSGNSEYEIDSNGNIINLNNHDKYKWKSNIFIKL